MACNADVIISRNLNTKSEGLCQMNPWPVVKHLFDFYDGFPDIKMENLSEGESCLSLILSSAFVSRIMIPKFGAWSVEKIHSLMKSFTLKESLVKGGLNVFHTH